MKLQFNFCITKSTCTYGNLNLMQLSAEENFIEFSHCEASKYINYKLTVSYNGFGKTEIYIICVLPSIFWEAAYVFPTSLFLTPPAW